MRPVDYRYNQFTDTSTAVAITGEEHRIPSTSPFTIKLREVPVKADTSTLSMRIFDILTAAITSAGATSITVKNGAWFANGKILTIDSEQLQVTADPSGNTLTVSRGYGGTTATTHVWGAKVYIEDSMEEVAATPNAGQYFPDYYTEADGDSNWSSGEILVDEADAGKTVSVNYTGKGAPIDARSVAISIPDHIVEGLTIEAGSGLVPVVKAGKAWAGNELVEMGEDFPLAVQARRAALVYLGTNGIPNVIKATPPAADAGTVYRWDLSNWDGSSQISSTVGSNNLIPNGGLTREVGWFGDYVIKSNGSTGYLVSANSTDFPTGGSAKEIVCTFIPRSSTAGNHWVWVYGNTQLLGLAFASLKLYLYINASWIDTGYVMELDKKYKVSVQNDNTAVAMLVNGEKVFTTTAAVAVDAGNLYAFRSLGAEFGNLAMDYIEMRNAIRTDAQNAALSNALLLPYRYYADPAKPEFTDIRSIIPASSTSLGRIRTDDTGVIEIRRDYQDGVREGISGGNRSVFLGWQAFSGSVTLSWVNPFGTRKVKARYVFATNTSGQHESPVQSSDSSVSKGVLYVPTVANPLRIFTQASGVVQLASTWQTSGCLGCYVEVEE
ncbi:hypothetical protein [Anaeroselena agilis]|uniref:Uncharacterized protein n=1 Tax=Anaeroselena agilis TaxID=3063788 RepID=A0ABU3NWI9_9FIRM|nr:hypothetical protein [Selenomonadales bacterium 4137-cl]